jgi:hypothetical protein
MFGPNKSHVIEEERKLHNEDLYNLYSSPNTIRMIKSDRMRWAGYESRMREKWNAVHTRCWWERDPQVDLDVGGK